MSGEFELIDRMLAVLGDATAGAGVVIGPGDDAAVLQLPPAHQLVVSTDTLVAGRHYPAAALADLVGYRSMAVAVSDLAAMGAAPAWATVSLTSEELTVAWAERYASGVAAAARDFAIAIVGGNVARGPQSVTVTAHGHVPASRAISRAGARPGDRVYITGSLGGAGLALGGADLASCVLAELPPDSPPGRYWKPRPPLAMGVGLRGVASAAIDLSDGLASDLEHLCRASGVACDVDLAGLPVFPGCEALDAVCGGDDYELAFTAPAERDADVRALAGRVGVPVSCIATARAAPPDTPPMVTWYDAGVAVDVPRGYRHF